MEADYASPVSRVAAAAVFILAMAGVAVWLHSGGATYALADFIQPLLEAKTVKYKIKIEIKGPPRVTITGEMMMLDANGSRQETQMSGISSKSVQITDWSQGKSIGLIPAFKTSGNPRISQY